MGVYMYFQMQQTMTPKHSVKGKFSVKLLSYVRMVLLSIHTLICSVLRKNRVYGIIMTVSQVMTLGCIVAILAPTI